ncbi:MAG: TssQ family T6SS-associated lipoprotein [Sulfurimicrobium sp.]
MLTATGCASLTATKPARKIEEAPVARKVEKTEEPGARKPELPAAKTAEQQLSLGIHDYEEGNYKDAAGNLQNALNSGLASSAEQITAHKYLAFIYCVSGEKLACRGEFKKILKLNPKFNLAPAEAGHPLWGPVFRAVKAEEAGGRRRGKK